MKNKKLTIGYTGPSKFSAEIQQMIENHFNATPIYINQNDKSDIEFVFGLIDGLILSGGSDIYPLTYNSEITNCHNLSKFDVKRDNREWYLIDLAMSNKIPVLGICRGHQILGIYNGLPFYKDISGSNICHSPSGAGIELDDNPCHFLYVKNDEHRKEFDLEEKSFVNSFHHQAVKFGDINYQSMGVDVIGISALKYEKSKSQSEFIIELMRGINDKWLSCQFHPEADYLTNPTSEKVLNYFRKMLV